MYSTESRDTPLVPSVNAFVQEPTQFDSKAKKPVYYSAVYRELETNLPKELMRFNKLDFGAQLAPFPTKSDVLQYVQSYAKPIESLIRYNADVESLTKTSAGVWDLTYRDYTENFPEGTSHSEQFDAVVVANGHYELPYVPDVEGMADWAQKFPGSIQHAKYFNEASVFAGKTVLVIGNASSGVDISLQAADYAKKVYRSIASKSRMTYASDPRISDVPVIEKYDADKHEIVLKDVVDTEVHPADAPKVLRDVDVVIYCTGYLYTLPFLKSYMDPSDPDAILHASGARLYRTYKHIFYIPDPTLSFIGIPKLIIPFPLAELQGAVVARVLSGRIELPPRAAMLADEARHEESRAHRDANFHDYVFPDDVAYYRELDDWVRKGTSSDPAAATGFFGESWGEDRFVVRRDAFARKGEHVKAKLARARAERERVGQ